MRTAGFQNHVSPIEHLRIFRSRGPKWTIVQEDPVKIASLKDWFTAFFRERQALCQSATLKGAIRPPDFKVRAGRNLARSIGAKDRWNRWF